MEQHSNAPHQSPPDQNRRDLLRKYRQHLRRHLLRCTIILAGCITTSGLASTDVVSFQHTGHSLLHPALSLFIAISAASLAAVASTSIWTTIRRTLYLPEPDGPGRPQDHAGPDQPQGKPPGGKTG